ncbi:MAG: cysteine--1-D-myo-inosityl 2-amino-2-deoxy-alpha-D-glucopyranoside ligase [Bifidobacteriaceae bacterium]|jgi:L-cysteine:1D-myo-inositol 2-amino-2-deoxy-alpha-D-glucopyranoside ligase|nr:cysteine--1-D-myo-inosityl 2-amino-2-deoxy-alpha-D-glucopyranoside ligase [Bifidobacteriaceae bacterium]
MHPWTGPIVSVIPGTGEVPRIRDDISGEVRPSVAGESANLYVCGITPYDSTHLGHAFTYLAFDLLVRAWRDLGVSVRYAQGLTDVDDPLLERARATGKDWSKIAARQTAVYKADMAALRVIPPDFYRGVVESVPQIVNAVERMIDVGQAYRVAVPGSPASSLGDVYADLGGDPDFGSLAGLGREAQDRLFAERGGDPDRPGKRDRLDPLLWRAARPGEPSWDGRTLGRGRPGWHIECAVIASAELDQPIDVLGGGADLIFPHHEMSVSHSRALTGLDQPVRLTMHTGMVHYDGQKMSKSLGNLVFVSDLLERGVGPAALRLALIGHHYGEDWEWRGREVALAEARLNRWRDAIRSVKPQGHSGEAIAKIRAALADNLDTAAAIAAVDEWVSAAPLARERSPYAAADLRRAIDALLGIKLY